MVESSADQKPNFAKSGSCINGAIITIKDIEIYERDRGIMDQPEYQINIFSSKGRFVEDFLEGKASELPIDETLSSNGIWNILSARSIQKLKHSIRLGKLYRRLVGCKNVSSLKPRTKMEEAINNHFKNGYEIPEKTNKKLIGVALEVSNTQLKIALSQEKEVFINFGRRYNSAKIMEWFKIAVESNLIVAIEYQLEENGVYDLGPLINCYIFDSAMDRFKRREHYLSYLSVSKYSISNTSKTHSIF